MDVVLISITGLSLILAIAMGVILFNVLREDRARADARVALLVAATAATAATAPEPADELPVLNDAQLRDDLFTRREEASPWTRRIAVAAALATLVAVAGYLVLPRGAQKSAAATAAVAAGAPLELLTLGQTQADGELTVNGVVHNPRTGTALKQVVATAFLFGAGGTFLASGRANLDFTTLSPGDDSPFVIKIPVTGVVTRYRVGFRGADGAVIAHVDRRGDGSSARYAPASGSTPWAQ